MKFFILILCCLFSFKSWADCTSKSGSVVFFDFDNSKEEVEGAKQTAAEKCQNFYVFKSEKEARESLKKIEASGDEVSSLILSGHHKFGIFWGDNFHMTIGGFSDLMDEFPNMKSKIKNLYLWGCYTNNLDKLDRWLKSLPQLEYVFGFNQKAPLSKQMTGVEYLKSAMTHQGELEKINSLDQVKNFLDTKLVPGSSPQFQYVSAAIYGKAKCDKSNYKDFYYYVDQIEGGTKSSIDKYSERGQCDSAMSAYKKKYKKLIEGYWKGDIEVLALELPESKDPVKNPIRMDIYPWANKFAYCFNDSVFKGNKDTQLGLGQLLNMVYFQTIKANFFEYFKNDTENLKTLVKDKALIDLLGKGEELSRKEVLSLSANLSAIEPQTDEIKNYSFKLKKFLVEMDDRCTDINWLEDASAIQKPSKFCSTPAG